MAAATVSGSAIRIALAEAQGGWVVLSECTAAGTASRIDDTRVKGVNVPSGLYDNCIVRITSGARQGNVSFVDYVDPINGYIYVTPDLAGALSTGDDYEVWFRGIDPDVVDRLRDDCLERFCSQWRPIPLSLIVDGDMEESGVSNWTAAGGATRTKALSTLANDATGRWNLLVVVTTATTDLVSAADINVSPGEMFYIEAPVSAYVTSSGAGANASIRVYDVTNAAYITLGGSRTTHTGPGPGRLHILVTAPSGCYKMSVRITSTTASSTVVVGPIHCHKRNATRVVLPDRIRTRKRVGTTFGTTTPSAGVATQTQEVKITERKNVERIQQGSRVIAFFNPALSEEAVWFYERGYFARLSATYFSAAARIVGDDATTDCPKEYVVAALAERVAKHMMDTYGADWQDDWVRASTELAYWEGEFGPEPKFVEENETPVYIPQWRV